MEKLSHVSASGKAQMVNVSNKPAMIRTAFATGHIALSNATIELIRENGMKKGDVLTVAEIAGIQGGKKTSELIPLCHPLLISHIDVTAMLDSTGVTVTSEASCTGQTGIEMEALTACSIGLLTIYDMCKAIDKGMVIDQIRLLKKVKKAI